MELKDLIPIIISIVALLITIFSIYFTAVHYATSRFVDMFSRHYYLTFELRNKISEITQKYEGLEFYYEIDIISSYSMVEEMILDYLTEMESLFFYVKGFILKKSFRKLVSKAFYQRIIALHSYILWKRTKTNNSEMFTSYVTAVEVMRKMKKIRKQLNPEGKRYYVGLRTSDSVVAGNYFVGDISMFSNEGNHEFFQSRPNPNISNNEILPYYSMKLEQTLKQTRKCEFVFYNPATAYNYSKDIVNNSLFLNSRELLNSLNNKLSMKKWLIDCGISTTPFETFLGKDILQSKLFKHFPETDAFVIQTTYGGGGIGTFLIKSYQLPKLSGTFQPLQQYLVSPYIKHGVSLNTHVFIAEKHTVLSPPSIQLVEVNRNQICYRGADFIAVRDLSEAIKSQIRTLSLKIAGLLREKGYRGIAGIDFLADKNDNVYCIEINPRFQASTFLLDKYLQAESNGATSSFELNEMAFNGVMNTTLCFESEINYICYYYYATDGLDTTTYTNKYRLLQKNGVELSSDGFETYMQQGRISGDSYLFRATFPHRISKISPDTTLWVNDNIRIAHKPKNALELKVALLNQGIRMEGNSADVKQGVYESIDIEILPCALTDEKLVVNCAVGVQLAQHSPFWIKASGEETTLYYYDDKIAPVTVESDQMKQHLSETERKILYLATDRLRIKMVSGCENKNMGKGCKFCNLPPSTTRFSINEIICALEKIEKADVKFRHILIGGGTCLSRDIWDDIISLCARIKAKEFYKDKPISLMSVLPPENMLHKLRDAGVEEVAFNLEIANDALGQKFMPEKRKYGKEAYYETFRKAVVIFDIVRSTLLVGLDKEDDLYAEISALVSLGVLPCLSALRVLPNSDLEGNSGPTNQYLLDVYNNASALLNNLSENFQELGPSCAACRNNILGL